MAAASINRKLHLVIPLKQESRTVYVHSTPLDRSVMDSFFLPIAKTFAAINAEGLGILAGPKVASRLLKAVSESLKIWDSDNPEDMTVKSGVLAEIRRLTNVFVPGPEGWQMLPLEDAVKTRIIDADDAEGVENIIVFFTVNWLMHSKEARVGVMESAAELWDAQLVSSTCTEYRDSLRTSTPAESSGESKA